MAKSSKPNSNILEAATEIFNERQDSYSHPGKNFSDIAKGWSVIAETEITPAQVALMMMWLKICREKFKHKDDNLLDIIGYVICSDKINNP